MFQQASLLTSKLFKILNIFGQNKFTRPSFSPPIYMPCLGLIKYFDQIQFTSPCQNSLLEVFLVNAIKRLNQLQNTHEFSTRALFPCMMLWGLQRIVGLAANWLHECFPQPPPLSCNALDNCTALPMNCTATELQWAMSDTGNQLHLSAINWTLTCKFIVLI